MYLVEALRPEVTIDDLGITVRQGIPVWVSEEDFRRSLCLRHLARIGSIRVSSGERSRVTKKPHRAKAQVARLSRPRKGSAARPPAKPPPPPPAPPPQVVKVGIPAEEVDAMIKRAAEEASRRTADAILARLSTLAAPATPSVPSAAPLALSAVPEEPVYIPKGIVGDEETDLHIEAETAEAEGLDAAAAALKALRKKD